MSELLQANENSSSGRGWDSGAVAKVVDRYVDQVRRAARGAGLDATQADDVTQATFVTFIETIERFEGRSHVRTWLFGILYKKIAALRRGSATERDLQPVDAEFESRFNPDGSWVDPPRQGERELETKDLRRGILACLDAVPERQRLAFTLREVEGLGSEEMCKILGVSRTNLGVMLHRVRNKLRGCLEAKGLVR